jgi:serine O-acetyltransferase
VSLFRTILADLRAPTERDPAARGYFDVLLSYPGFHAITAHRFIHELHRAGVPLVPRFLSQVVRFATGIEIHPGARIGEGFFIDHGMGVVIGETVEIGNDVTIYQGVTLGGTSLTAGKRHPTLGNGVTVGVNAAVLGAIELGDGSKVGAGSVVVRDVPPNATVVGVPGHIVAQDGKAVRVAVPRSQVDMPDPEAVAIGRLAARVNALEARLAALENTPYSSRFSASVNSAAAFEDVYPVI